MSDNGKTEPENDILIRREGRAGRITLNRPDALNALTYAMVTALAAALEDWRHDPAVALVILDGAGTRGLCAGGDVRSLYDSRPAGTDFGWTYWADEYRLNAVIKHYPKPYVAIMDGIVMGGGIGVSAHGSHRVVTEHSQLAMPETGIGLIPDVGGSWLLARAPGETGTYLGLTGGRMKGAGTMYAGFADSFVPQQQIDDLIAQLSRADAGTVDAVIAGHTRPPPPSDLADLRPAIDAAFAHDSVEDICAHLAGQSDDWAAKTLRQLRSKSPLCLKLALAALRNAHKLNSFEDALKVEYRLVCRLFERGEFIEGTRALIVDKDRNPRWSPPRLENVSDALVADYFSPLPGGHDLTFPSKAT